MNQQHGSRPARKTRFRRLIRRHMVTGLDPLRFWYRYRSTPRVCPWCRLPVNSSTTTYIHSQSFQLFQPVPRTTHGLSPRQPGCPHKGSLPWTWLRDHNPEAGPRSRPVPRLRYRRTRSLVSHHTGVLRHQGARLRPLPPPGPAPSSWGAVIIARNDSAVIPTLDLFSKRGCEFWGSRPAILGQPYPSIGTR